jgi:ubiquitin fusion degradation protein 1
MESPYTFEVRNAAPGKRDLKTHCGVLEFIADPGTVHLPAWMMKTLQLNEGDPIRLTGARLPKGKFAKVQAQSPLFLELSDHKSVLESAFRNFSCLTKGDIIEIYHNMMTFEILIMELKPDNAPGVLLLDTDLEIDFAPPKGYVEPKPQPLRPAPTMASKLNINTSSTQSVDARGSEANTPMNGTWEAFKGGGKSMGGKTVKGKGVAKKKVEAVDAESKIWRTGAAGGTGRTIKMDEQMGDRRVPARLELPYGTLFFGYNVEPFKPADPNAPPAPEAPAPAASFSTVSGAGNTLSGRPRPAPPPVAAPPLAVAPSGSGDGGPGGSDQTPFGGEGYSLTGNKPTPGGSKGRDVIEID